MARSKVKIAEEFSRPEAARLPEGMRKHPILFYAETNFSPPTDVWETREEIRVVMELAHVSPENLTVYYQDGFLYVNGMRPEPGVYALQEITRFYQKEIDYGEFRVKIKMNSRIDRNGIQAVYRQGMLMVQLPKITRQELPGTVKVAIRFEE